MVYNAHIMPRKRNTKLIELKVKKVSGLNVNFCRNQLCNEFGKTTNGVVINNKNEGKQWHCNACKKDKKLYSNDAVIKTYQEMTGRRYISDLKNTKESCKNKECSSHGHSVKDFPALYKKNGKQKDGSQRYQCKSCNKTLTMSKKKSMYAFHRKDHKNKGVFMSLMQGLGIRKTSYLNEINVQTVYGKMEFFYKECLKFNHHFDKKLSNKKYNEISVAHDGLHLTTNWRINPKSSETSNSSNQLEVSVCIDANSGYVLVQTIPFDTSVKSQEINEFARTSGELDLEICDREYPHYLYYDEAPSGDRYLDTLRSKFNNWVDIHGIKLQENYAYMAHYYSLSLLTKNTKRLVVYSDAETHLFESLLGSLFTDKINKKSFKYYKIHNEYQGSKPELREHGQSVRNKQVYAFLEALKDKKDEREINLSDNELDATEFIKGCKKIEWKLLSELTKKSVEVLQAGKPKDALTRVVSEPKALNQEISLPHQTFDKDEIDSVTEDVMKLSINRVDSYFNNIRVMSFFDRSRSEVKPVKANWKNGRSYDPKKLIMLAEIFKTYYNFIKVGTDGETPAQRMGLTKKVWTINEVLTRKI